MKKYKVIPTPIGTVRSRILGEGNINETFKLGLSKSWVTNMDSSVYQRLSLLLDGEASEFETRRLVEDISKNPHIKKRWLEMNKQKSALRRLLMPNLDLSSKFKTNFTNQKK